jgi:hypothetical protein
MQLEYNRMRECGEGSAGYSTSKSVVKIEWYREIGEGGITRKGSKKDRQMNRPKIIKTV